jgi:hypothetical protein
VRLKGGVGPEQRRTAVLNDLRKLPHEPSLTTRGVGLCGRGKHRLKMMKIKLRENGEKVLRLCDGGIGFVDRFCKQ